MRFIKRFWLVMVLPFLLAGIYVALKPWPGATRDVNRADLMESMKIYRITKQMEAPDFELRNLDGGPVRLSHYRGKVVLISFWTTW